MVVSSFQIPVLYVSPPTLDVPYAVTELPQVITSLDIRSISSTSLTGEITWSISASPSTVVPIPGIEIVATSSTSIQLVIRQPVSYFGTVYITATNPKGISSQASVILRVAADPVIRDPGPILLSRPQELSSTIPFELTHVGSGPVIWRILQAPAGVTMNPSSGVLIINNNLYAQTTITVTATNVFGRFAVLSVPIHVANRPQASARRVFTETGVPNVDHVHTIYQVVPNTGPITWALSNASRYPSLRIDLVGNGREEAKLVIPYGSYLKENLAIEAKNNLDSASSITTFVHVAPTPIVPNPIQIITSVRNSDFLYPFTNTSPLASTVPITWSLIPSVSGISIQPNTGMFRVAQGTFITNQQLTVAASNEVGGIDAETFSLSIAQAPILAPVPTQRASMLDQDFTLPIVQTAQNTGPLIWSTCNYPGLSINASGLLRVQKNFPIECNVSVMVANNFQGFTSVSFLLDVSQIPIITVPREDDTKASVSSTTTFTYPMTTSTVPQSIFWSIRLSNVATPTPSALSIHPTSGVITVQPQTFLNDRITVTASNLKGDVAHVSFPLQVAEIPDYIAPLTLEASLVPNIPFTYSFSELSKGTGGTEWNVSGVGGAPPPADLTFPRQSNTLQFTGFREIDTDVLVLATNQLAFTAPPKTVRLRFERTPVIQVPSQVIASITSFYTFTPSVTNGAPVASWEIRPVGAAAPSVSINHATGQITFMPTNFVYQDFSVTASNAVGGQDTKMFFGNVCRTPKLIDPVSISCNLPPGQPFSYAMMLDPSTPTEQTGPITWSVSPALAGLTIGASTGVLTVSATSYVQSRITVRATNRAQGFDQISFDLLVTHTPTIVNPGELRFNTIGDAGFTYTFQQTVQGTGPLSWSLLTPIDGVQFTPSLARLFIPSGTYVNASAARVLASNVLGQSNVTTFAIRVAQAPAFTLPDLIRASTSNQDFTYAIQQSARGTGTLTWSLAQPVPAGVSISSQQSNLIAVKNNYVNRRMDVIVFNEFGGVGGGLQVPTTLLVAQEPIVVSPGPLSSNFEPTHPIFYRTRLSQTLPPEFTGPLTWRVQDQWGAPIPGLTIDSTGLLALDDVSVQCNVVVSAINGAEGSNSVVFPMTVAQTPIVINPTYVAASMTSNFTYAMQTANAQACRPLTWEILRTDNPADPWPLSIHRNSGVITFSSNHRIDTQVRVTASNALGSFCNVLSLIHI